MVKFSQYYTVLLVYNTYSLNNCALVSCVCETFSKMASVGGLRLWALVTLAGMLILWLLYKSLTRDERAPLGLQAMWARALHFCFRQEEYYFPPCLTTLSCWRVDGLILFSSWTRSFLVAAQVRASY